MADDFFGDLMGSRGPISPGFAGIGALENYLTQSELMKMKREEQKLAVEREHRMQQTALEELQLRREEALNTKQSIEQARLDRLEQAKREQARLTLDQRKEAQTRYQKFYQPGDFALPEHIEENKALGGGLLPGETIAPQQPPEVGPGPGQMETTPEDPSIQFTGPLQRGGLRLMGTAEQREDQTRREKIAEISQRLTTLDPGSPEFRKAIFDYQMVSEKPIPAGLIKAAPIGTGNYNMPGVGPIVGQHTQEGRIFYKGQDVTDQVKPYQAPLQERQGLTPTQEITQTRALRNDYVREVKPAQMMSEQLSRMKSSLAEYKRGGAAAGAQGVLVTFQKVLDPTSVVRESEYARSSAGLSLMSRLEGAWQQIQKGGAGVPESDLETFVDLATSYAQQQQRYAEQTRDQVNAIADKYGLDRDLITREIKEPGAPAPPAGPTPMALPSYETYQERRRQQRQKATP